MDLEKREVSIGLLGVGTVGTGVAKILLNQAELLEHRTGISFRLKSAPTWIGLGTEASICRACGALHRQMRFWTIPRSILWSRLLVAATRLISILRALNNSKHVVTANKALIATKGRELFSAANASNTDILFEASVGGGIPIVKGLREGLVANRILNIYGIVNGTSNYILTRMHQDGLEFEDALREAQDRGFAEADPTLDISGEDAAHKLVILASIAASKMVDLSDIYTEGIAGVTKLDVDFAKSFGYTIKLLAICRMGDGEMDRGCIQPSP